MIRRDDHENNTPRQINLYRAVGADVPHFAHVPMILGADGQRLSKRHGAVSVIQYEEDGYLPQALNNYLARLGWSHGNDEVFDLQQFVDWFDLEHISRSAAQFNPEKLLWLNQHYLKAAPDGELAVLLEKRLAAAGIDFLAGPHLAAACALYKPRVATLEELADAVHPLYVEPRPFYVSSLQQLGDSAAATSFAKIRIRLIESIYYRFTGSYEKCLDAVTNGLELSMNSGVHVLDIWLLTFGISSALNVGDTTTAGKLLEKMTSMNKVASLDWWTYHQLRSREALSRGDPEQASFHIVLAFQFGENLGVPSCICDCHIVKSYALHQLGKYQEAEDHLAHASQIASQMKSKLFRFYTLLAGALFVWIEGMRHWVFSPSERL